jgi:dTDP-4-amino-4,6-dideoxygalactose transaminase
MSTIPLFKVFMSDEVTALISATLLSGHITQGPHVEEFEEKLRDLFNYPYIVTLNSATSGLTMALRMIKDSLPTVIPTETYEVLSVPLTCMATNVPILATGLRIKWVDVHHETGLIDLVDLERKITEKTRILTFVHWGGYPVDMDALKEILDRKEKELGFRVQVIEDCAHAFLSEYKGRPLGTSGNFAVFSLQAIKHLTTGDGGLLFCPDKETYDRAKILRWYGIDRDKRNYKGTDFRLEADVKDWGYKFHMNDINATIGLANLPHIAGLIERARETARYYDEHINNSHIKCFQPFSTDRKSAYWLYTIMVDEKQEFIDYMKGNGIMVSQVHQRNDVHTCFAEFRTTLPQLDIVENHIVCIPVGWWITCEQRNTIVNKINSFKVN